MDFLLGKKIRYNMSLWHKKELKILFWLQIDPIKSTNVDKKTTTAQFFDPKFIFDAYFKKVVKKWITIHFYLNINTHKYIGFFPSIDGKDRNQGMVKSS